jgi:hypothetical protein
MTYGGWLSYDGAVSETAANSGGRKRTEILKEGKFLSEPKFLISSHGRRFVAHRNRELRAPSPSHPINPGTIPRKQRFRLHEIDAALRAAGGVYAHAARLLSEATGRSCTRQNIQQWVHKYSKLTETVREGVEEIKDLAETALIENIRNGDTNAIKFYLETKGKDRGYEQAGLRIVEQINFAAEVAKRGDPPHQANDVVMGDDFELRRANVMSGLREQRLVDQLIIAEKA